MQTLSVLAVEDGAIIVASPAGERFRLPVDAALRARLQQPASAADEKRLSPREIQAHVRAGRTAEQVAAMTGVPVAFIERFVGPVLAERAYIVESALAVRLPPETEGARSRTFGAVMGERLDVLAAREVRWTSAREPSGWVLAVSFVADSLQHDARWRFDPKHMRLEPDNIEASTLSQLGQPPALAPRLRAIEPTAPVTIVPQAQPERVPAPHGARVAPAEPDRSRFDSAAFRFPPIEAAAEPDPRTRPSERRPAAHVAPTSEQRPAGPSRATSDVAADELPETRAMDVVPPRAEGEVFAPRPATDRPVPERPQAAPVRQLPVRSAAQEVPVEDRPTEPFRRRRDGRGAFGQPATGPRAVQPVEEQQPAARPRRGRTSMPSWDEIVFGRDEQ